MAANKRPCPNGCGGTGAIRKPGTRPQDKAMIPCPCIHSSSNAIDVPDRVWVDLERQFAFPEEPPVSSVPLVEYVNRDLINDRLDEMLENIPEAAAAAGVAMIIRQTIESARKAVNDD